METMQIHEFDRHDIVTLLLNLFISTLKLAMKKEKSNESKY